MYYSQNHYNVILFQTKWRSAVKSVRLGGGTFSDLMSVLSSILTFQSRLQVVIDNLPPATRAQRGINQDHQLRHYVTAMDISIECPQVLYLNEKHYPKTKQNKKARKKDF